MQAKLPHPQPQARHPSLLQAIPLATMRKLPSKREAQVDCAAGNFPAGRQPEEIQPEQGKTARQRSGQVLQVRAVKVLAGGVAVSSRCFSIIKTAHRANQVS